MCLPMHFSGSGPDARQKSGLPTQVQDQNPKLAKQSRVLKVSMDAIYDFAINPNKERKAEGVVFRFMPDAKEVQSALEVT